MIQYISHIGMYYIILEITVGECVRFIFVKDR